MRQDRVMGSCTAGTRPLWMLLKIRWMAVQWVQMLIAAGGKAAVAVADEAQVMSCCLGSMCSCTRRDWLQIATARLLEKGCGLLLSAVG